MLAITAAVAADVITAIRSDFIKATEIKYE